jgi:hypothetical protein
MELTPRWYPLEEHPTQMALAQSRARFKVVPAGRRSGKTERAKREGVKRAVSALQPAPNPLYVYTAPTHDQARQIFWTDLKAMVPDILRDPTRGMSGISESHREIYLWNGGTIRVAGMDRPERIEGEPVDWICLDEYGNMRESAWTEHVRPALSTKGRLGEAWFIGVPEGRNHYHDLYQIALNDDTGTWAAFHWVSADIIDPEEVDAARRDLDPRVFRQEYEGSFEAWEGRAYYAFERDVHARERLRDLYSPDAEIIVALDFNISPGVAAFAQEVPVGRLRERPDLSDSVELHGLSDRDTVTCWFDEIWVERDSNTVKIAHEIRHRLRKHHGGVVFYGDATGGAGGTAKIWGSDWDLLRDATRTAWGGTARFRVKKSNPPERVRVNAVNTRYRNGAGQVRMFVDAGCKHIVEDFDAVPALDDGSIDKKADPRLTHISDAVGYYVDYKWPVRKPFVRVEAA